MDSHDLMQQHLHHLTLSRLGTGNTAGLVLTSLPLPRKASTRLSLDNRQTYCRPLGQWPGEPAGSPRRVLMIADGGDAPAQLAVSAGSPATGSTPPVAEMAFLARNDEPLLFWEKHALKVAWGGRTVELVMGLRTKGEVHWWEACRLVTLEETPACRVVEMGGAIPVDEYGLRDAVGKGYTYNNPYLHRHNWLNGHILARLHANGVCEIFAHHINSKFFDDGLSFEDVVPVIGMRTDDGCQGIAEIAGAWDGAATEFTLGRVAFDMTEVARLATSEKPGSVLEDKGFVVLQPYQGVEIYGGLCPAEVLGDPYAVHAEEKRFPRGLARTLRFTFSLSPDRSPRVARYLAPAWWYGVCEEFMPAPFLPVSNEYDWAVESAKDWIVETINRGGFEDGAVPRHEIHKEGFPRHEPGWEGEIPYAQFLSAWRTGDADEYDCALRSAYFINDIVMDHASKAARMHGYAPPFAFAPPMTRVLGSVAAFLETGDKYLLDTARAVTEHTYWIHKNSWPRAAVGRDACFIRGAVLLYRYLGETHYSTIARDALHDMVLSQRPNGSFGDQGGGSGIHQWGQYITKPWMGCMAVGGALDYLELFPDDDELLGCVKRFMDWLMSVRYDHDGVMGWSYQHDYAGDRMFIDYNTGEVVPGLPSKDLWHQDYFARLFLFCALRFRNPAYFAAWVESFNGEGKHKSRHMDHPAAQSIQFVPWVQAWLWQARLTAEGLAAAPCWLGECTPAAATVLGPQGPVEVKWQDGAVRGIPTDNATPVTAE